MKSMEEMIKAAQAAAETIQKQMTEAQNTLDKIEVEGVSGGGPRDDDLGALLKVLLAQGHEIAARRGLTVAKRLGLWRSRRGRQRGVRADGGVRGGVGPSRTARTVSCEGGVGRTRGPAPPCRASLPGGSCGQIGLRRAQLPVRN